MPAGLRSPAQRLQLPAQMASPVEALAAELLALLDAIPVLGLTDVLVLSKAPDIVLRALGVMTRGPGCDDPLELTSRSGAEVPVVAQM